MYHLEFGKPNRKIDTNLKRGRGDGGGDGDGAGGEEEGGGGDTTFHLLQNTGMKLKTLLVSYAQNYNLEKSTIITD